MLENEEELRRKVKSRNKKEREIRKIKREGEENGRTKEKRIKRREGKGMTKRATKGMIREGERSGREN